MKTTIQYSVERGRRGGWELQAVTSTGSDRAFRVMPGRHIACRAAGTAADARHAFVRWLSSAHPAVAEALRGEARDYATVTVRTGDDEMVVSVGLSGLQL